MLKKLNFFTILKVLFLLFIIAITLLPLVHMVAVSLSGDAYIMRNEVGLIPKGATLKTYGTVLKDNRILTAYGNTILYTVTGTLLSLFLTVTGAFALSRRKLIGKRIFSFMIVFTMLFSGGMIPTYLVVKSLGMVDNIWGVILPGAVSPWYLIIMRTFFQGLPMELEESGKIDGLNDLGVFWYLALPLSGAALASIGLFYAVGIWNAFFGPFIYLNDETKFPLQVLLRQIVIANDYKMAEATNVGGDSMIMSEALKFATIIVSTLPIMLIYPFVQKYFVKGVMVGSVKG